MGWVAATGRGEGSLGFVWLLDDRDVDVSIFFLSLFLLFLWARMGNGVGGNDNSFHIIKVYCSGICGIAFVWASDMCVMSCLVVLL